MQKLSSGLTIAEAEILASRVLGHMAQDSELFGRFLSETGIALAAIRQAAAQPGFLPGVLDFMMRDEAALLDFARSEATSPEKIVAAHRLLSGARGNST